MQAHAKAIFGGVEGTGTNITAYLKNLRAARFGVTDVPDTFIFKPEQLGSGTFGPLHLSLPRARAGLQGATGSDE
jgi:hypothetical protein